MGVWTLLALSLISKHLADARQKLQVIICLFIESSPKHQLIPIITFYEVKEFVPTFHHRQHCSPHHTRLQSDSNLLILPWPLRLFEYLLLECLELLALFGILNYTFSRPLFPFTTLLSADFLSIVIYSNDFRAVALFSSLATKAGISFIICAKQHFPNKYILEWCGIFLVAWLLSLRSFTQHYKYLCCLNCIVTDVCFAAFGHSVLGHLARIFGWWTVPYVNECAFSARRRKRQRE